MKVYITFGQIDTHSINGLTMDKNCVAVINCKDYEQGRNIAMDWFDAKFHNCFDVMPSEETMSYYPRGLIEVNQDIYD